jgi:hypothetical protein
LLLLPPLLRLRGILQLLLLLLGDPVAHEQDRLAHQEVHAAKQSRHALGF